MKKNIALLAGGNSGEAVVSLQSAMMVEELLDKEKYDVYKITVKGADWHYSSPTGTQAEIDKTDFSITIKGVHIRFDCAFIIIHGDPGENGKLQGYLEMLGIPHTTCDSITSALTFNKAYCNAIVKTFDVVNISNSIHLFSKDDINIDSILGQLSLPVFVKPNAGGSSVGMSKVHTSDELEAAIKKAFAEDDQVLIEEFVKGRELTCGMIKALDKKIIFPITEIKSKKEFFDYEAKYQGMSDEITPAEIEDELKDLIQATSSQLYTLLNCKGIVRLDYIFNEEREELYFLEVNTVPGQSRNSIVPQQVRAMGWSVTQLYDLLIEESLKK